MMLSEVAPVPGTRLPVEALRDQLRLGSSLNMGADQDGLLRSYLGAAIAVIEGRVGKVLFQRDFRLVLNHWRDCEAQALPLAPVRAVNEVRLIDGAGTEHLIPSASYRLIEDHHRPKLAGRQRALPTIPTDGRVEIQFQAGFGLEWGDLPADLRQAVLLLAAEYYEHRHDDENSQPGLPHAVEALIKGWRQVRLLAGGRR